MEPIKISDEVRKFVDVFAKKMTPIQRRLYDRVQGILHELSVDADGNIKRTVANSKIISRVQKELSGVVNSKDFQGLVSGIDSALVHVDELQTSYFDDTFDSFDKPKVVDAFQEQSFDQATQDLTSSGLAENVVSPAVEIVNDAVRSGGSIGDMNTALRDVMLGDATVPGRLVSYSKQIVGDTMHMQARNYNSLVTKDLDLSWFVYVGSLKDTSRPWCVALAHKKWIHKSELGDICQGNIDGHAVSLAGLMPETNPGNVIDRCGGYNCTHAMVPVPTESVPSEIRFKFNG